MKHIRKSCWAIGMEWKGKKIDESFLTRVEQLQRRRKNIANEIRNMALEFKRRSPQFRQGTLYLAIREHRPACPSCPHGPYWYQATFTRQRKWIGRYIGRRLTKTLIYKTWNYRRLNLLLQFDRKAHELRERKRVVSKAFLSLQKILKSADL